MNRTCLLALVMSLALSFHVGCTEKFRPDQTNAWRSAARQNADEPKLLPKARARHIAGSNDPRDWGTFVPSDSRGAIVTVWQGIGKTPSGRPALETSADKPARYGITPLGQPIPVLPGQRYRLSAWAKAESEQDGIRGTRGVLLRATLFTDRGDYPEGHYYVGAKGTVLGLPAKFGESPAPTEWTRLEGVVEIPPGINRMKFHVFCWWTRGTFAIDDPKIELVSNDVPPTPLL